MNKNLTVRLEDHNLEEYTKKHPSDLYNKVRRLYGFEATRPLRMNEVPTYSLKPITILVRQICFNVQAGMRLGC